MASGGGTTIMGSQGNVYAPGGQGVVTAANGTDILYYHYCKLTHAGDFYYQKLQLIILISG